MVESRKKCDYVFHTRPLGESGVLEHAVGAINKKTVKPSRSSSTKESARSWEEARLKRSA